MYNSRIFAASLLGVVALALVSFVFVYSRAGDVLGGASSVSSSSVEAQNAVPLVDSVHISDTAYGADAFVSGLLPNIGTTVAVHVAGTISDSNGKVDIASTSLAFYRSGVTGGTSCTDSGENCYHVVSCAVDPSYGGDTEAAYDCLISVQYWADATDVGGRYPDQNWIAQVTVADKSGAQSVATSTVEVNSLLALNIPTAIDYGTFNVGEHTGVANNQQTVLTQRGNEKADIEVSGTAMPCHLGSIPVANQQWSLVDTDYGGTGTTNLSETPAKTGVNVGYRESDTTEVAGTIYWNLRVPSSGVSGTCAGTNTLTVLASTGQQGILQDSAMANVDYTSPSHSGVTDATGHFLYEPGETVTFKIGQSLLGAIATVPSDGVVFPQDLVGVPRSNTTDARVVNIARFVQSLDDDNDPTNGITITPAAKSVLTQSTDVQTTSVANLTTLVQTAYVSRPLVSQSTAVAHLDTTVASVQGAATVTLYAASNSVAYGASTMLTWDAANVVANSCVASGDWSGTQAAIGSVSTGNITSSATYTITCTKPAGGTVTSSATVAVGAAPSVTFTADDTSIAYGMSTNLHWVASNIVPGSCIASGGWSGPQDDAGTIATGALTSQKFYALTCSKPAGGTIIVSVTIAVGTAPTLSLTVDDDTMYYNGATTLRWTAADVVSGSCVASGNWSGSKSDTGSVSTGTLTANRSYTLTCNRPAGGTITASVAVSVGNAPALSFSADSTSIAYGMSTNLHWDATDVTAGSCVATGDWSGSKVDTASAATGALTANKTYTITCSKPAGGTITGTINIMVGAAPTLSITVDSASIAYGLSTMIRWSATNIIAGSCVGSDDWSGSKSESGSGSTGTLTSSRMYTLTCSKPAGGTITQSVSVAVGGAPSLSFSADNTSLYYNGGTTLRWTAANVVSGSCVASNAAGWSGAQSDSGTQSTGALTANQVYVITCNTPAGGTITQNVNITVGSPPALSFSADSTSLAYNGATTLHWSAANVTSGSCTATGGWTGSQLDTGSVSTGNLPLTATFTITCNKPAGGTLTQSVTITVADPPPATLSFYADSLELPIASSTNLNWVAANVVTGSCVASGDWTGTKSESGSASTGNISVNKTYTLTCNKLLSGTIAGSVTVVVHSGQVGAWATSTNPLPVARTYAASVVANGYVYEIGGDTTGAGTNPQSTVYYAKLNSDGTVGTWTNSPHTLPALRSQSSAVVGANGYVYVFGGYKAGAWSDVYYAKLNTDGTVGTWTTSPNVLPSARYSSVAVTANGYAYVIGGYGSGAKNTVFYTKLNDDGTIGAWTTSSNTLPANLYYTSAAVANGYAYVMGGYNPGYTNTVYYAKLNTDGTTGAWQTNANGIPTSRNALSAVAANGFLYTVGGYNASLYAEVAYAKVNSNGTTGVWAAVTNPMPAAREFVTSVVYNGYLYALGGDTNPAGQTTVYYTRFQ